MSPGSASMGSPTFDSALAELDPSLRDGLKIIYDRECPFEMRIQEDASGPHEVGTLEAIRVKVLLLGDPSDPRAVRMELTRFVAASRWLSASSTS